MMRKCFNYFGIHAFDDLLLFFKYYLSKISAHLIDI